MAENETQIPETEQAESPATEAAPAEKPAAEKKKKHDKPKKEQKALEELQAKFDDLNERYLRMAAEYDNFRKRSAREREGVYAEAVAHAVKALLPTFDNLERALAQPTEDAEYKKGVELTHKQLVDALGGLNVTLIEDAPGTAFDPNLHNAIMHVDDEALGESVIAETFQRGFQLGDKVVRHSMVKVAN